MPSASFSTASKLFASAVPSWNLVINSSISFDKLFRLSSVPSLSSRPMKSVNFSPSDSRTPPTRSAAASSNPSCSAAITPISMMMLPLLTLLSAIIATLSRPIDLAIFAAAIPALSKVVAKPNAINNPLISSNLFMLSTTNCMAILRPSNATLSLAPTAAANGLASSSISLVASATSVITSLRPPSPIAKKNSEKLSFILEIAPDKVSALSCKAVGNLVSPI